MIRLAYVEAREFGHPGIADEHLVLGLLRHGTGLAADLLRDAGLDPPTVRSELLRLGPTLAPRVDPAAALRSSASTPTTFGSVSPPASAPPRSPPPSGGYADAAGGAADTPGPAHYAYTCRPNARSTLPSSTPHAAATTRSAPSICCTGCSGTPATLSAPSSAAAAAGSSPPSGSSRDDPTRCGSSWRHTTSTPASWRPSSAADPTRRK
jgi:hypothetical protein